MPVESSDVTALSNRILEKLEEDKSQEDSRVVVLIYGAPGSGKSTSAELLTKDLNARFGRKNCGNRQRVSVPSQPSVIHQGKGKAQTQICQYNEESDIGSENEEIPFAIHLKMDGFHLPLSVLDEELKRRRGCQESFDDSLVVKLVELLLNDDTWSSLSIPDFDHATKDPVNPGIYVSRKTKVVVFEGLYLMLGIDPWSQIPKLVKETIENKSRSKNTVQVAHVRGGNETETAHRIALRHLQSGLVVSYDEGRNRYFNNDLANAEIVENQSVTTFDDIIINNSIRLAIP
ncbi:hypothetical protein PMKS-002798 [Pichia membranifaciens]|uniref:Phosphoribulokinase/uridine kinase domain-containing protein n=1 Tax=Pichia membranifaciens TaxID=4926 RepID=A0A1Q2YID7_9ASCO|nr:hypothetical protein PMKS-002798 [Pichia membranifaciens]